MDLGAPRIASIRSGAEPILPMINLVFLLLIFLLLAATLVPPAPVTVETPRTSAAEPMETQVLRVSLEADGALAFESVRGPAVLAAIAARMSISGPAPVALYADRSADAATAVRAAAELAAYGATSISLVVEGVR